MNNELKLFPVEGRQSLSIMAPDLSHKPGTEVGYWTNGEFKRGDIAAYDHDTKTYIIIQYHTGALNHNVPHDDIWFTRNERQT